MTKEEALKVLMKMRAWRRWGKGEQNEKDRPEMPEQKEVDGAFDICIEILSKLSFPSDLDKAAEEYVVKGGLQSEAFIAIPSFKAGAKWDRKQMMSNAVEGWVAVDSDIYGKRRVTFFPQKPVRDVLTEYKYWAATRPRYESIKLDSNAFPSLKWEDEPKKVKLIIVKED